MEGKGLPEGVRVTGRRIAVIGSGVSGITAGYVLSHTDYVTIFEADGRLGGHADTHLVAPPSGPPVGVDTGFIVYNERTYPLLTRLFLTPGLARGRPAERIRYLRMLAEIPRFHRAARRELARPASAGTQTLGEFLRTHRFGAYFTAHFALPLVAAVWSCPPGAALRYPARYLFAFLANHGMLSVSGAPPWRTVTGGSRHYVERAAKRRHDIRLSTPVRACSTRPPRPNARCSARSPAPGIRPYFTPTPRCCLVTQASGHRGTTRSAAAARVTARLPGSATT